MNQPLPDAAPPFQDVIALILNRASPLKRRVFCGTCGSPLFSPRDDLPDVLRLRAGTLDGDGAGLEIGIHIQTASKAAWWTIGDDRPQHPHAAPT